MHIKSVQVQNLNIAEPQDSKPGHHSIPKKFLLRGKKKPASFVARNTHLLQVYCIINSLKNIHKIDKQPKNTLNIGSRF